MMHNNSHKTFCNYINVKQYQQFMCSESKDLKILASALTKHLLQLKTNKDDKKQFYHKINGNVSSLFGLISDHPTIHHRDLSKILQSAHVRVLIKNKNYLTPQDLHTYLNPQNSRKPQKIQKKNQFLKVQVTDRYELQNLLQKDLIVMQEIRNTLKSMPSEDVFGEIDFFGNGYFDATSLVQFIKHYDKQGDTVYKEQLQQNMEQLQNICNQVIRYLKNSITADKIFYKDFLAILAQQKPQQSEQEELQPVSNINRTIGHIAKTNDLQVLNSRSKNRFNRSRSGDPCNMILSSYSPTFNFSSALDHTINFTRSPTHTNNNSNFTNTMILHHIPDDHSKIYPTYLENSNKSFYLENEKIKKQIQKMRTEEPSFQQKLIRNHQRNAKYLEKVKKQIGDTKWISSKGNFINKLINPESLNPSQIIYQLKYIGQIFSNHHKQVSKFIQTNPKFTLFNGFNVLDFKDQQSVTFNDFNDFIAESGIIIHQSKINSFFAQVSQPNDQNNRVIKYHNYVNKIFRIQQLQPYYNVVSKRKPLLMEKWPEQQKKNYCRFIRNIISLLNELQQAKISLCKMFGENLANARKSGIISEETKGQMGQKFQIVFGQSRVYADKMGQFLSKGCQALILQLVGDNSAIEASQFLDFMLK